jgi:hypothetical protein
VPVPEVTPVPPDRKEASSHDRADPRSRGCGGARAGRGVVPLGGTSWTLELHQLDGGGTTPETILDWILNAGFRAVMHGRIGVSQRAWLMELLRVDPVTRRSRFDELKRMAGAPCTTSHFCPLSRHARGSRHRPEAGA